MVFVWIAAIGASASAAGATDDVSSGSADTHPLVPGIRARELWDTAWPRTLHDRLATGFSPLTCSMKKTPAIWRSLPISGRPAWLRVMRCVDGAERILVDDGRLRFIDGDGKVLWTTPSAGEPIYLGDLRTNGGDFALMKAGRSLNLVNLSNGEVDWQFTFVPAHAVVVQGQVADILSERPGLEAAVFPNYCDQGCVINFPPEGEPVIVWRKTVVVPGEHDERYDHNGSEIELDVSNKEQPLIWNVRHHRCRGINARTGDIVSAIIYRIGDKHCRNYGPTHLATGRDGQLFACVFGEKIQCHVHAIRLHRQGESEIAWQHYYGEVYPDAGVTVVSHGMVDWNCDGVKEMAYSVKDPAREFRSFVRFRNFATGEIEFELEDHWGVGPVLGVGSEGATGFLAYSAPNGVLPKHGNLHVYRFRSDASPDRIAALKDVSVWGPANDDGVFERELLVKLGTDTQPLLQRYELGNGELKSMSQTDSTKFTARPALARIFNPSTNEIMFVTGKDGWLEACAWTGKQAWQIPVQGGDARISAGDLNADGRAELVAAMLDDRLHVYSFGSDRHDKNEHALPYVGGWICPHRWYVQQPPLFDLEGDGRLCIVTADGNAQGKLVIGAYRADGSQVWATPLDVDVEQVQALVLNVGRFLGALLPGVAVSTNDSGMTCQGTYLLNGHTGQVVWFKDLYRDGSSTRPFRPNGIPTAYDFDGDGVEEVGMDMFSYMAYVRGVDGQVAFARPTKNIRSEGALFCGHLYNTFCPLFEQANDSSPHWLVTAGFGSIGLMKPNPEFGVWQEELGYDFPPNVAMVDVDGDGSLEIGYAPLNDNRFVCRDPWSGKVEWTLPLPSAPNGATISADFDGDGRGEFYCSPYCIGTDKDQRGEIRWTSPVALSWPIVADFDGDGRGEIAGRSANEIIVLHGAN